MNFKAIILISILIMSGISSISSADVFSGFVDDYNVYSPAAIQFPQWKVSQYDYHGHTKLIDCRWQAKHKEKNLINQPETIIHYEYRDLIHAYIIFTWKNTILKLNIYNYHGGELKIVPGNSPKEKRDKLMSFNIYLNDKLVDTHKADQSGKAVTCLPN
ncbi:MAG: hypothetical protein CfClM3_0255 [Methanobrevibacter sp. CfCl-M3]